MKNNFRPILISLVLLIILSGIVVFAYRDKLWDNLSLIVNIEDTNLSFSSSDLVAEAIDLSIFKSETMKSLERQVVDFDFNNTCAFPSILVQTEDGFEGRSVKSCSVGTRLPFAVAEKK